MSFFPQPWDYLIITASNKKQAESYEIQIDYRRRLGLLTGVKQVLVVPDPEDRRIGSGGSTIHALLKVLSREFRAPVLSKLSPARIEETLNRLRILIIHAGGDSRRLPSYGPCGKIFTPIPGKSDSALNHTIFDRQYPIYRELPPSESGTGQVVVTTGDVLLFFSPREVKFRREGVTGLGCYISPEQAKNHGVFSADRNGEVRCFLQKPPISRQKEKGAINSRGKALLDIGVMQLDAAAATKLITLCNIEALDNAFHWTGPIAEEILSTGLDFYREICCAMGKEVRFDDFLKNVRSSGSNLSESLLLTIFDSMSDVPFFVHPLEECTFLHFGTPRQLIETGLELTGMELGDESAGTVLDINNRISGEGRIDGSEAWVEGCRIRSGLTMGGENVVVGVDVDEPLSLPKKTCLDILKGRNRKGDGIWFVRIYGIDDSFKSHIDKDTRICSRPASEWLELLGASENDIWDSQLPDDEKNLWNAKIFPAVATAEDYRVWLWMQNPSRATADQIQAWHTADRYSLAEISGLAALDVFYDRRRKNRREKIRRSLGKIFQRQSRFSAEDLAFVFEGLEEAERTDWIIGTLQEAKKYIDEKKESSRLDRLGFSRIVHTLESGIKQMSADKNRDWTEALKSFFDGLSEKEREWWNSLGLDSSAFENAETWCKRAQDSAFENLSRTIVRSRKTSPEYPRCAVRPDEIIWGRAPARLDLGGGWTDTPPYSLEHGGCVLNAAVNLNGQPPIQVFARVVKKPVIRIVSIDHGLRVSIKDLNDLMDYRKATSKFGLAKAALALSGFMPEKANWPNGVKTLEDMLGLFGGGIELTTLAAIPSGSGLGTSSIMGAVLMSVINKMIGKETTHRELFNLVLQLEQELTTGGGWQDQIGGTIKGVKMITTELGLVPDPQIQAVKADVLDPQANKGQTLLYYTGMRRLAKNILRNIVGHYLDRNRATMEVLRKLHAFPPLMVDAMAGMDIRRFGELIDRALGLKKEIDPDSSNPEMEKILEKFKPHMIGATFLGAGGGGFLLVVCQSPEDGRTARKTLEKDPPNSLARFFDYDISSTGLEVTVC